MYNQCWIFILLIISESDHIILDQQKMEANCLFVINTFNHRGLKLDGAIGDFAESL